MLGYLGSIPSTANIYRTSKVPASTANGYAVSQISVSSGLAGYGRAAGPDSSGAILDEQRCFRTFGTPFNAIVGYTAANNIYWDVTTTVDGTVSYYRNQTVISSGTVLAKPTIVLWKSADLHSFPTSYAAPLAAKMSVPFTVTSATPGASSGIAGPTSTPPPSSTPSSRAPDTAQKVAIGTAVVLGVLLLTAIVVALIWWRRRKKRTAGPKIPETVRGSSNNKQYGRAEVSAENGIHEFDAERDDALLEGAELNGESEPVELCTRCVRTIVGLPIELEAEDKDMKV